MTSPVVPKTLEQVLEPAWLSTVLEAPVQTVETVEVIRTVATKVRFLAHMADGSSRAMCLKGLLNVDEMTARGGPTMVREADFYGEVAAHVDVRVPQLVRTVIDRDGQQAVVLMRDLIADGAQFCSALEPFTAQHAAESLNQIARLHAGRGLLAQMPWIDRRIDQLAEGNYLTAEQLQALLDGTRGDPLPDVVRSATRLIAAMQELARRDAGLPQFLVHGDAHAGNIFRDTRGPGLIDWQLLQSGGWALDVAYHIAAVLPVAVAEVEERALLAHYLSGMAALGCTMPDAETAWRQYREAPAYGYYLWSITRRVDPAIIDVFVERLGKAVARHDSFALLGVA
jgi:aminoglycoside phosphotransferase (APT) family kinase protein